jgi:deazaflavin-dependent oxidoreductase (nitroreductase family)
MALKRNKLIEVFWKVHPALVRLSGGRIGGNVVGMPVLLLNTTGRKSGAKRSCALTYLPVGENFAVFASCLGEEKHPAWWLNLDARPDADVEIGGESIALRAREAEGDERQRLWAEVVTVNPDYAEYQQRTERRIPVVVLERRAS